MEDGGRIVKMEVDYSKTVDEVLPECQEYAKVQPQTIINPHYICIIVYVCINRMAEMKKH